jgi:heme oxygenase
MPTAALSTDLRADSFDAPASVVTPSPFGLRDCLRAATASIHAQLDRRVALLDLGHAAGYRCFLEGTAAALLPLEAALAASGVVDLFPDWPARSRRGAILEDLARLDGTAQPPTRTDPLTRDGVLGTLYVLEGSRLGARVLVRRVERSADPAVAAATAYLRHGAGRPLWPSYLATLEREAAAADTGAVVDAARRAFARFDGAFAAAI